MDDEYKYGKIESITVRIFEPDEAGVMIETEKTVIVTDYPFMDLIGKRVTVLGRTINQQQC